MSFSINLFLFETFFCIYYSFREILMYYLKSDTLYIFNYIYVYIYIYIIKYNVKVCLNLRQFSRLHREKCFCIKESINMLKSRDVKGLKS